jgi:hypothetical protein
MFFNMQVLQDIENKIDTFLQSDDMSPGKVDKEMRERFMEICRKLDVVSDDYNNWYAERSQSQDIYRYFHQNDNGPIDKEIILTDALKYKILENNCVIKEGKIPMKNNHIKEIEFWEAVQQLLDK